MTETVCGPAGAAGALDVGVAGVDAAPPWLVSSVVEDDGVVEPPVDWPPAGIKQPETRDRHRAMFVSFMKVRTSRTRRSRKLSPAPPKASGTFGSMRNQALALLVMSACGGGSDGPSPDASTSGAWTPLITKGWTLQPGGENTSDLQLDTTDHDIVIGGIRPLAPTGTHHTLLFRGASGTNAIYASGVGTNDLMFPPARR